MNWSIWPFGTCDILEDSNRNFRKFQKFLVYEESLFDVQKISTRRPVLDALSLTTFMYAEKYIK